MDTYGRITDLVTSSSCDFLGVADLAIAQDFVREQGGDVVAGFPKAVSIGIALPRAIVDQLPNRSQRVVARTALAYMRARAYSFTSSAPEDVHAVAISGVEAELGKRPGGSTVAVEVPSEVRLVLVMPGPMMPGAVG